MEEKIIKRINTELDKTPNEKIIDVIVKMVDKGILKTMRYGGVLDGGKFYVKNYDEPAELAENMPIGYIRAYKCGANEWHRENVMVVTVNSVNSTIKWNPDIVNPDKLLLALVKKYKDVNEKVCEIEI